MIDLQLRSKVQLTSFCRVTTEGREGIRDFTSRMGREEIFFNFPFRMKKKRVFIYEKQAKSHISCGKGRDFFQFPFPLVKREEILFPFPFPTATLSFCDEMTNECSIRSKLLRTSRFDVSQKEVRSIEMLSMFVEIQ